MPPAAKSDKMKLKRIKKKRRDLCFSKLIKEIATKVVAEVTSYLNKSIKFQSAAIMALQKASEAFLVIKFEDMVFRALKASRVTKVPISIAWK